MSLHKFTPQKPTQITANRQEQKIPQKIQKKEKQKNKQERDGFRMNGKQRNHELKHSTRSWLPTSLHHSTKKLKKIEQEVLLSLLLSLSEIG
jgi:hypothetical protein